MFCENLPRNFVLLPNRLKYYPIPEIFKGHFRIPLQIMRSQQGTIWTPESGQWTVEMKMMDYGFLRPNKIMIPIKYQTELQTIWKTQEFKKLPPLE
jgi:hypothetical protein